jgi:hypothetical protein
MKKTPKPVELEEPDSEDEELSMGGRSHGLPAGRTGRVERIGGKTGKEGLGRAHEEGPRTDSRRPC